LRRVWIGEKPGFERPRKAAGGRAIHPAVNCCHPGTDCNLKDRTSWHVLCNRNGLAALL
jgi:hypothetical protein